MVVEGKAYCLATKHNLQCTAFRHLYDIYARQLSSPILNGLMYCVVPHSSRNYKIVLPDDVFVMSEDMRIPNNLQYGRQKVDLPFKLSSCILSNGLWFPLAVLSVVLPYLKCARMEVNT